jgi:hypothetical protein
MDFPLGSGIGQRNRQPLEARMFSTILDKDVLAISSCVEIFWPFDIRAYASHSGAIMTPVGIAQIKGCHYRCSGYDLLSLITKLDPYPTLRKQPPP